MKKKHEREPEQIQYHFEYAIGEDLPAEIYLTATDQEVAIRSFARHCIRFLEAKTYLMNNRKRFLIQYYKLKILRNIFPEFFRFPKGFRILSFQRTHPNLLLRKLKRPQF